MGMSEREPQPEERPNVAVRASRIRSRMVFTLLDAICVVAGYGLAEVAYFRDKAPAHYWQHFLTFLVVALVLTLVGQPRLRALRPDVAPRRSRRGPPAGRCRPPWWCASWSSPTRLAGSSVWSSCRSS